MIRKESQKKRKIPWLCPFLYKIWQYIRKYEVRLEIIIVGHLLGYWKINVRIDWLLNWMAVTRWYEDGGSSLNIPEKTDTENYKQTGQQRAASSSFQHTVFTKKYPLADRLQTSFLPFKDYFVLAYIHNWYRITASFVGTSYTCLESLVVSKSDCSVRMEEEWRNRRNFLVHFWNRCNYVHYCARSLRSSTVHCESTTSLYFVVLSLLGAPYIRLNSFKLLLNETYCHCFTDKERLEHGKKYLFKSVYRVFALLNLFSNNRTVQN